jgi:sterol desaturase/sphingolipid hydroxylase (fatty acid hydroxylase superfamily)
MQQGKYLKKFHMDHHFAEMGAKWGVSSPLWDIVFGTVEERRTSSRTRKSHS